MTAYLKSIAKQLSVTLSWKTSLPLYSTLWLINKHMLVGNTRWKTVGDITFLKSYLLHNYHIENIGTVGPQSYESHTKMGVRNSETIMLSCIFRHV